MDLDAVHHQLRQQDGLVSRRQLHAAGLTPGDVERVQRRRELTRLLPGVYIDHTGRPTWTQRAWAGVLHYEPAALVAASALRAAGLESLPGADRLIAIGVAEDRRVRAVAGYGVVRMSRLEQRVRWTSSPPRQLSEDALLDLAGATTDELDGVQLLADAIRSRHTTAARLLVALDHRPRQARRPWVSSVLTDLAEGTCSVLEHGYLVRVERPHSLPRGHRQQPERSAGGLAIRDVCYLPYAVTVELNGRMFHDGPRDWDADLERELDAAVAGGCGLRLGWGQVFRRPCRTAIAVGSILRSRGWSGRLTGCAVDCPVSAGSWRP
ncbi:MAG TPA: hypothetical protein VH085_06480 [Nocardioides sp.]|jgi:hypothetical protein|nr:hypothetical protein [Nocardioides sp.]